MPILNMPVPSMPVGSLLQCPNDPDHNAFSMTAMVPEIWRVNKNGVCGEIVSETATTRYLHSKSDLTHARCTVCWADVVIAPEDN